MRDFLKQVQAALWNGPMPETVDEETLRLHMRQGTATLVFPLLPMTPMMKMVCVQTMQEQVKVRYVLERAWQALEQAGIKAVLMKGVGLAMYWPEPSRRPWGDIDLYVGPEQYHPACAVMRAAFPDALKFDEELDHYKHYNLIADGVSIEVHRVSVSMTHPRDVRRYAKMEKTGMDSARLQEIHLQDKTMQVRIFEPTFNALMVMLHAWEHFMTQGANLRQICDLALLLKHTKNEIDAPRFKRWLKALRALDVWQLYMGILVHGLRMKADEVLFYDERVAPRAQKMLEALLNNRSAQERPQEKKPVPGNRFVRKWHTMQERLRQTEQIAPFSPQYARHQKMAVLLSGMRRVFAPDRRWE